LKKRVLQQTFSRLPKIRSSNHMRMMIIIICYTLMSSLVTLNSLCPFLCHTLEEELLVPLLSPGSSRTLGMSHFSSILFPSITVVFKVRLIASGSNSRRRNSTNKSPGSSYYKMCRFLLRFLQYTVSLEQKKKLYLEIVILLYRIEYRIVILQVAFSNDDILCPAFSMIHVSVNDCSGPIERRFLIFFDKL